MGDVFLEREVFWIALKGNQRGPFPLHPMRGNFFPSVLPDAPEGRVHDGVVVRCLDKAIEEGREKPAGPQSLRVSLLLLRVSFGVRLILRVSLLPSESSRGLKRQNWHTRGPHSLGFPLGKLHSQNL